jgi:hypothetical protein
MDDFVYEEYIFVKGVKIAKKCQYVKMKNQKSRVNRLITASASLYT